MYDTVITRLREMNISEGVDKSPFRVIEEPSVPIRPIPPPYLFIMGGALAMGCFLGLSVVIGLDVLDSSLRTVDKAEELLGVSCLSVIPEIEKTERVEGKEQPIMMIERPTSPQAEGFRTLATSLLLLGDAALHPVFLFTSAIPSEGKSFTALNAAAAFALEGHKTLLIDADLRCPVLQEGLTEERGKTAGLSDLLAGIAKVDEAIHVTSIKELSLLPAGRRAPNPTQLLGGNRLADLLTELKGRYDRIVNDSAPVNAVSDT